MELLFEILKYYGVKEVFGPDSNPEILEMFHDIGYGWVQDDETAWCSAAMNYFCKKLGYERSGKLDAKSWLNLPTIVTKPQLGDLVVFWRVSPTSWQGHVGLYISERDSKIFTLGGNQEDMIGINPYLTSHVLGYRKVRKLNEI